MHGKQPSEVPTLVQSLLALADSPATVAVLQEAELCDKAKRHLREGKYIAALELVMPLAVSENSLLADLARDIAVFALDEIVDQYYEQGDYQKSIYYLEQWLTIEPKSLYAQIRKAEILWWEMEDAKEARRIYRAVAQRYPKCLEAWIGLAEIALHFEQYQRAYSFLRRAWTALSNPEWAYPPTREIVANVLESLYVLTARLLVKLGDTQNAKRILLQGVERIGTVSSYVLEELHIVRQLLAKSE